MRLSPDHRFIFVAMLAIGFTALCARVDVANAQEAAAPLAPAWPPQLEAVVPFEPTPFRNGGRTHLAYEILLRNFASDPVTVRRIEVFDADANGENPFLVFDGAQLVSLVQPVAYTPAENQEVAELPGGASAVVFMWLSLDPSAKVPQHFRHRVFTADSVVEGPLMGTQTLLRVLAPPVSGAHWFASDGPNNDEDNHHRRGLLAFGGHATIDRRFATDWLQKENGATYSGDKLDKHSFYAFGKPVLAVADARVVSIRDGLPDNVPGHNEAFHPAVPITFSNIVGNTIVLDLGHGQFAHYFHLEAGSLQVKAGDRVKRGQLLARIGGSGDAREPHLHFEITTSAKSIFGEGVPYVIDEYLLSATGDRPAERRTRELPMRSELVDFR